MSHSKQNPETSGPWHLVGTGFLALAVSFSVRAVLGLAMPAMERELGWSYAFLSGTAAMALLIMAAVAPLAGRMVDTRGPRSLLAGGLALVAVGAGMVAMAPNAAVFVAGFAGFAALGFAAVATNVVAASIARGFRMARGLATGIGSAGATAGQLLVVPLVALLVEGGNWRAGFAALGTAATLLSALAWVLLPRGAGRGRGQAQGRGQGQGLSTATGNRSGHGQRSLWREPVFYLLFWSFLICGFTTTGVIETHLLPYAAFCGFLPLPSAAAYGVLSAVNMGGMVLAGWLSDRVHRPTLLGGVYLARAACFVLLLFVAPDIRRLYLFAALFGLFDYSTVPVTVALAAGHLGTHRIGLAMGLISAGHALGGAAGALAGGLILGLTGGYAALWGASTVLAIVASLLALGIREHGCDAEPAPVAATPAHS
ncbi:MAG TPA: MFS transporter [Rhodopila sp.]|nr:MFS transporter [Rhodopila sp.]